METNFVGKFRTVNYTFHESDFCYGKVKKRKTNQTVYRVRAEGKEEGQKNLLHFSFHIKSQFCLSYRGFILYSDDNTW